MVAIVSDVITESSAALYVAIVIGTIASWKALEFLIEKTVDSKSTKYKADAVKDLAEYKKELYSEIMKFIELNNSHFRSDIVQINSRIVDIQDHNSRKLSEMEKSLAVMDTEQAHTNEKLGKMEEVLEKMDSRVQESHELVNKMYTEFLAFRKERKNV